MIQTCRCLLFQRPPGSSAPRLTLVMADAVQNCRCTHDSPRVRRLSDSHVSVVTSAAALKRTGHGVGVLPDHPLQPTC